jgi:hypothetical protein
MNGVLCFGTLAILFTGLRLWLDALVQLVLLPDDPNEIASSLFFLAWLFLAALVAWQGFLVYDAIGLFRSRPR